MRIIYYFTALNSSEFMKKTTLLFFTLLFCHAITNAQNTPLLNVKDTSGPTSLRVGNVAEFVYKIENIGQDSSKLYNIWFRYSPDPDIEYYPVGAPKYYITHSPNILPGYYNSYTYSLPVPNYNLSGNPIKIDSSQIDSVNGKHYLGQDESLYLHIPFRVKNCAGPGGTNLFYWDSAGYNKDSITLHTAVNVDIGTPSMLWTTKLFDSATYCPALHKDTATVSFTITNNNSNINSFNHANPPYADSLRLYLYCSSAIARLDFTTFKINGHPIGLQYIYIYQNGGQNIYLIDLSKYPALPNGHPFGYNTICDNNGDSIADQLAADSSFTVTAKIIYDTVCPSAFSQCTSILWYMPAVSITYVNQCHTTIPYDTARNVPFMRTLFDNTVAGNIYRHDIETSSITTPADVTNSKPDFNVQVCPNYYQLWEASGFNFDCPRADYQLIMPLDSGYHLDTLSAMLKDSIRELNSKHSSLFKFKDTVVTYPPNSPYCSGKNDSILPAIQEIFSPTHYIVVNFGKLDLSNCSGQYNTAFTMSCLNIPCTLDCADIPPSRQSGAIPDPFSFTFQYVCDTGGCPNCGDILSCSSTPGITHHCAGACTSIPYTKQGWTIKRTNLGYINQNIAAHDYYSTCDSGVDFSPANMVSQSDTLIDKSAAYPGDQIEVKINGGYDSLFPKYDSNEYVQFRYDQVPGSAQPSVFGLDPDKKSYFIIHGSTLAALNGVPLYLPPCAFPHLNCNDVYYPGGPVKMNFSLRQAIQYTKPALYPLWLNEDTAQYIIDSAHIFLRALNGPQYVVGKQFLPFGDNTINLRAEYMLTKASSGPPQPADTVHSCDSWGNAFDIYQPLLLLEFGLDNNIITGCDSLTVSCIFRTTGGLTAFSKDDFPYEFRPFTELDSVFKFVLPPGYQYRSIRFSTFIDNYDANISNNHFRGGDTQVFFKIKPVFNSNPLNNPNLPTTLIFRGLDSSCFPLMDEKFKSGVNNQYEFDITTQPLCSVKDTAKFYFSAGYRTATQQSDTLFQSHVVVTNDSLAVIHQNPVVILQQPHSVNSYNNLITFTFQLCDANANLDVTDGWVAFKNILGDLLNLDSAKLYDITTSKYYHGRLFDNDSGVIFDTIRLQPSICDSFKFYAYTDSLSKACPPPIGGDTGKILVRFGNICNGILSNPDSTACENRADTFYYNIYATNLQLIYMGTPDTINLCSGNDTLQENFSIVSADYGTISHPFFWVQTPIGVKVDKIVYQYPCPGGRDTTIFKSDTIVLPSDTVFGWNLNKDLKITGLTGVHSPNNSDSNKVCVTVYLTLNCRYPGGDSIKFFATGITTCSIRLKADTSILPKVDSVCFPVSIISQGTFCAPDSGTAIAHETGGTPPFTYLWSNGATTDTVNGLTAGKYYVLVTDSNGCRGRDSVTISIDPHCCHSPHMFFNGQLASRMPANPYTVASASFTGTFIVDTNFTFLNCPSLAMDSGAIIQVDSGVTLTIDSSRLYTCGDMWQGIIVKQGGNVVVKDGSIVEDAQQAVYAKPGGSYSSISVSKRSLLNDNFEDIYIDAQTAGYNLYLDDATLTCKADGSYSPGYLKLPRSGLTLAGVYLQHVVDSVTPVTVGTPGTSSDQNNFSNIKFGVYADSSDFNVYNNRFNNLTNSPVICPPPCVASFTGIAVYGVSNYTPHVTSTYHHAYIGDSAVNGNTYRNIIFNCFRGVDLTNYVDMAVLYNDMNTTNNVRNFFAPQVGDHGVFIKMKYSRRMDINNNTIIGFNTAIHLSRTFMGHGTETFTPQNINSNILNISGSGRRTNSRMFYGILAENTLNQPALDYLYLNIFHNKIYNAYRCIECRNMNEELNSIIDNPVIEILPSSATYHTTTPKAGVEIDNCQSGASSYFIIGNNPDISAPGTAIQSPAISADTEVIGIHCYLSQYKFIKCNNIHTVGQCMRFDGNCTTNQIFNDTMNNAYDGFVLWKSGVIGQQGGPNSPIGEIWGLPSSFKHSQTFNYKSPAPVVSDPLYMYSVDFPTKNLTFFPGLDFGPALHNATGSLQPCPSDIPPVPLIMQQQLNSTVQDSVPYVMNISSSQYISKQVVLETINADTSLMAGDTILQNFNTSAMNNNMGALYKVKKYIGVNNISMASVTNSSISPNNTIEQNHKTVNDIYLNTIAIGIDTATQSQLNTLFYVALQCPLIDGRAVFEARSLINYFLNTAIPFSDSACTGSQDNHRSIKFTNNDTTNNVRTSTIKVFPNPANTILNVELGLQKGEIAFIYLYNDLGQQVQKTELKNVLTVVPINTLSSGIYYYKIIDDEGNLLKTDKQAIIH